MKQSARYRSILSLALLAGLLTPALFAQRTGYTPEEFVRRRAALLEQFKDGAIVLNSVEITEEQLLNKLKTIAEIYKDQAVILRGDREAAYDDIIRVLDVCQKAKIWNVAFATNRPEEKS